MLPGQHCRSTEDVGWVRLSRMCPLWEGGIAMNPEGTCEVAWLVDLENLRHYCFNAATCRVVVNGEGYDSCDVCRNILRELDRLEVQAA